MMSIGMHMRIIGHPGRTAGLWRRLDYLQQQKGVWITRRIDIANHWIKTHPYPGKGPIEPLNATERARRPSVHREGGRNAYATDDRLASARARQDE